MAGLESVKKRNIDAVKNRIKQVGTTTTAKTQKSKNLESVKARHIANAQLSMLRSAQTQANRWSYYKQKSDWEEKSKVSALQTAKFGNAMDFVVLKGFMEVADEEQRAMLNYLYQTNEKAAEMYLDEIKPELRNKLREKENQEMYDWADDNEFLASLASVGTGFLSVIDGIGNLGEGIGNVFQGNGFTYDTNNDIFVHATNSLRGGASDDMGAVGKFIYNTGMSIADNLVRLPLGPTGAALMAMGQAASQNIVAGKQMGMSDGKAFLYGIITGGVEGLTEKISVDKLLDKTQMAKSVKGYILKNVISEGQEEAVSELADKTAQFILAGDEAEWRKEFAAYKAKGYSDAEAFGLVVANTAGDVGLATLSGMISGGVMGGGSVGVNAVQNNFADRKAGAEINLGANARSELINAAQASGSAKVQNTLGKLQNADASGNIGRTNRYTGKLYRETFNEANEKLHPYGNETETKKNGKLTHDAKVARKKLNAENARREEAGQASVVDEYNASEFGQKYKAFEDKLKNYNNTQLAKNAVAKNGKTTAENDDTSIYTISDDGKTYVAAKDANGESTLKEAEISELTELKDGVPYVKLADGSVVSAKEMVLPENIAKQYKYASTLGNTEAAKAFISGYSNYEGSVEAYAEEFMTAYELGKRAGDRGIAEMIKTLPESRQKSIVQNDAVAAAFDAGKARAEKLSKDAAKTKKAREAKKSQSQQGKESKDNVFESLDSYDSEEIASIKRDARNQIAESLEDIRNFIISSLNGKTRGRLFIGKLKSAISDKIKNDTNISTEGYSVILTSDEIKHIFKQHGDTEKEALRGQEALTVDNITIVLDAIFNPDTVSVEKDNNGVVSLVFRQTNDGVVTAVTIASVKKKALTLKSARITKKKQHISPPSDVQAPNPTSKNEGSLNTVSTDSISEKGEKVNTSDEKNSVKGGKDGKKRTSGSFTIAEEVDTSKLTATQKMAIKRLEILSKCLGDVNIEVIDQGTNAEGKYESDNGHYNPSTNTIYIDVNAGKAKVDGMFDYALVETLSHEVVHLIKEHSPADYEKLKIFLQDNVYTAVQWNSLVSERLAQYGGESKTTREAAEEEVVANGCQTMLNSPRVLRALAKENYSLLERIKLRIANFFDRLTVKLGEYVNYTAEARLVMASTQKKQKALEKAFIDAVRNVRSNAPSNAESTDASTENAESQEIKASKREDADADINDYVDKYTAKEYNSYGWARANDVLSAKENERLRSLFAQAVTGNYFPKTKSGEYMIAIGKNIDNKIAYMTGEIDNPVITRILEIDEYNVKKLDELRRETYALERRGIQRKAGGVFHTYTAASFGSSGYQSRSGVQSQRYNNQLGTERGRGSKTTSRVKEILFDDDGNEISREYIRHSKRENDETYSTEELANAFESIAKTKHEKSLVRQYKDNIGKRKELIDQRFALIKERSDWRGQKGSEAAAKRSELNAKIKNLSERISRYDLQLLNLQKAKPLKEAMRRYVEGAVERERIAGEIYYGAVIARQKRKHKEELKAIKEKYKAQRAKAEDSENKRESKEDIIKKYKKLSKTILSPDKGKYVPQYLQGPLTEILTLITFDTTDTETNEKSGAQIKRDELAKKLRAVADKYDNLKEDELADYREEHNEAIHESLLNLVEVLEEADTNNVYEMNSETLVEVAKIINVVCETLVEARNAIHEGKAKTIRAIVDNVVAEQARVAKERKVVSDKDVKAIRNAARSLETKIISPTVVAREISGFEETSQFMELFNRFSQGQKDDAKFSMEAHKFFEDLTSGKKNREKMRKSQTEIEEVSFKDSDGKDVTVKLTKQMVMQILLSVEREASVSGLNHIFNKEGGLSIPDAKLMAKGKIADAVRKATDIKPTQEFVEKLKKLLDNWDNAYMDRARLFFNTIAKDAVNKTSLAVEHFEIATETDYIPFMVDAKALFREVGSEETARNRLISSYSITKKLSKNANQRLIMPGLDMILEDHIDIVSKYSGFAAAVKDFNKVWNSRVTADGGERVSEYMTKTFGAKKIQVLIDAIADLQKPKDNKTTFLDVLQRKFVPAKLLLNFGTLLKQVSSLGNAYAVLKHRMPLASAVYWLAASKNYKGICEEIDAHTAAHWQRRQGLSTSELGDLKTKTASQRIVEKNGVIRLTVNAIQQVDCITAATIWTLAKKDVTESGKYAADSAEYWDAVTKLYERALNETQATYDVLNRPQWLKGNGATRYFTLFRTEDFKRASMLYEAIMTRNWRQMIKTLLALLRSSFSFWVLSAISSVFYFDFDDFVDEEGEFSVEAMVKNAFSTMGSQAADTVFPAIGGSIFEFTEDFIKGDWYFTDNFISIPTVDFVNQTARSILSLSTGFTGKKIFRATALTTELATGVPILNIERLIEAITEWVGAIKDD